MKLEINYLPVEELKPYKNNARKHGEEDLSAIEASIRDFGFSDPIGVWGPENIIVEGHGRLLAAKRVGLEKVPCIRLDHLSDEQRRAYALAHNRTAELSTWDELIKAAELEDLRALGVDDLADLGFDIGTEELLLEDEEDFDETPPETPVTKKGNIWTLGEHRLMCGDSSSDKDVQLLMGGVAADMVFTDPPYGVAIGDKNETLNSAQKAGRCCENIENDTLSEEALYALLKMAFENVKASCKEDAVYYVTSPQGGSLCLMMMMRRDAGLPVRHVLMWRKNSPTFSIGRLDYDYQHEPIFYTWTKSHHNYRKGKFRSTVWEIDKPRKCDLHPTMKPVELVANAIEDGSKKGDIVLDVFGGSGSTLIAAEQTGRKCYMMELDPKYCDVIIRRWEQLTGGEAVKIHDGEAMEN